jgi:predicted Zn-dependent protease with MMP-like domain
MSPRIAPALTPEQIVVAREWLLDCYPNQEEDIVEASDWNIIREVARLHDGGIDGFLECFYA